MPVTICAAMRVGSARTTVAPELRNSWNPYAPTIVNSADPVRLDPRAAEIAAHVEDENRGNLPGSPQSPLPASAAGA